MQFGILLLLLASTQNQQLALCECTSEECDVVTLLQVTANTSKRQLQQALSRPQGGKQKTQELAKQKRLLSDRLYTLRSKHAVAQKFPAGSKGLSHLWTFQGTSGSKASLASKVELDVQPIVLWDKIMLGITLSLSLILFLAWAGSTQKPTALKSEGTEKLKDGKWANREVSQSELESHATEGNLWIAIEGVVCDLTEFAAIHPGGSEVLCEHAGKEAGEAFHEIGHSPFALELTRSHAIGKLVSATDQPGQETQGELTESQAHGPLSRLFSKEDPFYVHKVLGCLCLLNYVSRMGWLMAAEAPNRSDPCGFGPNMFSLLSVWMHAVLQCSSFIFNVPRTRVKGNPMIWEEYRAHNAIFVLRHVCAFTLSWTVELYAGVTWIRQCAMVGAIVLLFGATYAADLVTERFREDDYESTTSTMPYWEGCPVWLENFFKGYYTFAQLQATFALLAVPGTMLYLNFIVMFPIQLASLLMTLVRKGIISGRTYHCVYFWALAQVLICWLIQEDWQYWCFLFALWIPAFTLRMYGFPKFLIWLGLATPFALCVIWEDLPYTVLALSVPTLWAAGAISHLLLIGPVFYQRARRFVEVRPKGLILEHREHISTSLCWLRFKLPEGYTSGLSPGQHVKLLLPNPSLGMEQWNMGTNVEKDAQDISRSYTPVSAPCSKTLDLLIRQYAPNKSSGFVHGGRGSTHLVETLSEGSEVLLSGPHGHKVYKGGGAMRGTNGFINAKYCCAIVGGSGITPVLSILRAIRSENRAAKDSKKGITKLSVLHATRNEGEALPHTWYNPSDELDIAPTCSVCNLVTTEQPMMNPRTGQFSTRYGKVTGDLIKDFFPEPSDDVVMLICGPRGFVDACSPLVKAAGFGNVAILL